MFYLTKEKERLTLFNMAKKIFYLKPASDFSEHEIVKKQRKKREDFEKRNGKMSDEQWTEYQKKFIK